MHWTNLLRKCSRSVKTEKEAKNGQGKACLYGSLIAINYALNSCFGWARLLTV